MAQLTEDVKLTASDTVASDYFGQSVAIDGDRIVVSAPFNDDSGRNSGSAYIFDLDASGAYNETKLTPSDGTPDNWFGGSIAVDGDRVIVGAPYYEDINNPDDRNSGSVYIYDRNSTGNWVETKLTPSDPVRNDRFGFSVALDGNTAVVGTNQVSSSIGKAYVFVRDTHGNWNETQLLASDGVEGNFFGAAISIDGDRIIIGAPTTRRFDPNIGAVYVYERGANGNWIEEAKLSVNDSNHSHLGLSLDLDGDRIIASAIVGPHTSVAYIFELNGNGNWEETEIARTAHRYSNSLNGLGAYTTVSIDGDLALVGSNTEDNGNGLDTGSTYAYMYNGIDSWDQLPRLTSSDGDEDDFFGNSLSIEDGRAIIGTGTSVGAKPTIYLYDLTGLVPELNPGTGISFTDPLGTQTFTWDALNADVNNWWLYIGSEKGERDYFDSGRLPDSTLTTTVTGLPVNGSPIYVTLWYQISGGNEWATIEATYTAFGSSPFITSPAPGSILADSTETFSWSGNGLNVSHYWLYAGSEEGENDYFDSGNLGSSSNVIATGLPTDRSTVYIRLWYRINDTGPWQFIDETYTAHTISAVPEFTSPTPGSTLTGTSQIFTWSGTNIDTTEYVLYVGSNQGARNYGSDNTSIYTSSSAIDLPGDGSTVYVRLWYRLNRNSPWLYIDETYTTTTSLLVEITSPVPPGPLTDPTGTETFTWTPNLTDATHYWVYAGSSQGGRDYVDTGLLSTTATTLTGLPTDGSSIWIRLWHRDIRHWEYIDVEYTAAN